MNCSNCGAWNSDDAQFCSKCGAPLNTPINTEQAVEQTGEINGIGLIASLVLIASAFLPLYSVNVFGTKVNITLIDGTDWIIMVLLGGLGILFSIKDKGIHQSLCGVLGAAYFLYITISVRGILSSSSSSELASAIAQRMLERGSGYFALLLGSIGLIVAGMISKKNKS